MDVWYDICITVSILGGLQQTNEQSTKEQNTPTQTSLVHQAHYLIISKTYQRDGVGERDGQRDKFHNCYIFNARRAVVMPVFASLSQSALATEGTHHISHWLWRWYVDCNAIFASVVTRCVHNRVRVGVFCT